MADVSLQDRTLGSCLALELLRTNLSIPRRPIMVALTAGARRSQQPAAGGHLAETAASWHLLAPEYQRPPNDAGRNLQAPSQQRQARPARLQQWAPWAPGTASAQAAGSRQPAAAVPAGRSAAPAELPAAPPRHGAAPTWRSAVAQPPPQPPGLVQAQVIAEPEPSASERCVAGHPAR